MEKLTVEDLQGIATFLEVKAGIKIMVMPNEFMKEGVAFLLMNSKDVENMKEIFEAVKPLKLVECVGKYYRDRWAGFWCIDRSDPQCSKQCGYCQDNDPNCA